MSPTRIIADKLGDARGNPRCTFTETRVGYRMHKGERTGAAPGG